MATWPTSLPAPEREGYGYQLPDLTLRSEFALGARVRNLYTDGNDSFSVSVDLTGAQVQVLQGFIRWEIANGADWFDMPILASGTLSNREVRMLGPVRFSLIGATDFRADFQVETRTGTTISEAAYLAL